MKDSNTPTLGATSVDSKLSILTMINREFEIDFNKVKTIADINMVLKAMQLKIHWHQNDCPDQFKDVYEKGFLKEVLKKG